MTSELIKAQIQAPPGEEPDWWDEDKLVKICYNAHTGEVGHAIDLGDDTYILANIPITHIFDRDSPTWGDRVILTPTGIEKYNAPKEITKDTST